MVVAPLRPVVQPFAKHRVAARKGHSFIGFFVLSLFFFPLALIMAYVVQDRLNVAYQ